MGNKIRYHVVYNLKAYGDHGWVDDLGATFLSFDTIGEVEKHHKKLKKDNCRSHCDMDFFRVYKGQEITDWLEKE